MQLTGNKIMKSSQTVILAALGVVALGMVLAAGLAHVALSQASTEAGASVTRNYALTGFNGIQTTGRWNVTVTRGDAWHIEVTYPENLIDNLRVDVQGNHLVLATQRGGRHGGEPVTATVAMPSLSSLTAAGATQVRFSGFTGDELEISISGSGKVNGDDGNFGALKLNVSGSGQIDLRPVPVTDADVNVSGSADVSLAMNGGELNGTISGSGRIDYTGTTRQQHLRTFGSGRVTQTN